MRVPASDCGIMDRTDDYQALLKNGYGHIGRIGFLSPGIVDETLSAQWYRMAPAFAFESFVDESAAAAHADPVESRLSHMIDTRDRDVLTTAARLVG
jgi:hypothetical protein